MIGIAALLTMHVLTHSSAQDPGGVTLLQQVLPRATGTNGLEEYLAAGQVVQDQSVFLYFVPEGAVASKEDLGDRPTPAQIAMAARLGPQDYLVRQHEALQKFKPVFDLVRTGNAKPIVYPQSEQDPRGFPGYGFIKELALLEVGRANESAALGHTDEATDSLLDALRMVRRTMPISGSALRGSVRAQNEIFRAIDESFPRMTLADADSLQKAITELLADPTPAVSMIARGGAEQASLYRQAYSDKKLKATDLAVFLPASARPALGQIDSTQMTTFFTEIDRYTKETFAKRLEDLLQPESDWFDLSSHWATDSMGQNLGASASLTNLADAIAGSIMVNYRFVVIDELQLRAKLRLARLGARIVNYRWRHHALPENLSTFGPDALDPLSRAPFIYEKVGKFGFRLSSTGREGIGMIDLDTDTRPASPASSPS